MKNKGILFTIAIVLMSINFIHADFSAYQQLSLRRPCAGDRHCAGEFLDQNRRAVRHHHWYQMAAGMVQKQIIDPELQRNSG